jgi:hypothetical protein
MAMLVITGRRSLGKWTVRLDLGKVRVAEVMWARWIFGSSGSLIIDGTPSAWARSAPDQARLVIFGHGNPQPPTDCAYDGAPCTFAR